MLFRSIGNSAVMQHDDGLTRKTPFNDPKEELDMILGYAMSPKHFTLLTARGRGTVSKPEILCLSSRFRLSELYPVLSEQEDLAVIPQRQ